MLRRFASRALAALCAIGVSGSVSAEILVVDGSTTFESTLIVPYRSDIEAVSGHRLRIVPSKSQAGLFALLTGQADLAMISSPLESEVEVLRKMRPDLPVERLHGFLVHRTRVAFPIHHDNPVRSGRWSTIRRILSGDIDNWKQIGGPDLPIDVVARERGGALMSVEKQIMRGERISPRNLISASSSSAILDAVARDRRAVGIAQLGAVQRRKLPEMMLSTTIEQQLSFVTLDEPTPTAYAVIDATRRVVAGRLD